MGKGVTGVSVGMALIEGAAVLAGPHNKKRWCVVDGERERRVETA